MTPETDALQRILASREASQAHIQAIRDDPAMGREALRAHIRAYVFLRFLLEEGEHPHATFDELVEQSIAQTARIAPELVKELDTTRDCVGSTSAMAKKVLLLRGIEKALDITLPATPAARIVTLDELGDLVWDTLNPSSLS